MSFRSQGMMKIYSPDSWMGGLIELICGEADTWVKPDPTIPDSYFQDSPPCSAHTDKG